MKTIKLVAIAILFFTSSSISAQVSVNVNLGTPPTWGPVGSSQVDYYYLPDVESYYDIRKSQFIFFSNGKWIKSKYLPRQHRNYNLYNGYKVVLNDYHGPTPYYYFKNHKAKYYKGYKKGIQKTIGKQHNYNGNSNKNNSNGNDNHQKGKSKGNGKN